MNFWASMPTPSFTAARAAGAVVGFLSGLLANSGGILFAPLFIRYVQMPTKRALATSLMVSAMLALAPSVGALPCSYLGARLALLLRNETLEAVFGILLTVFGLLDFVYTTFHPSWLF